MQLPCRLGKVYSSMLIGAFGRIVEATLLLSAAHGFNKKAKRTQQYFWDYTCSSPRKPCTQTIRPGTMYSNSAAKAESLCTYSDISLTAEASEPQNRRQQVPLPARYLCRPKTPSFLFYLWGSESPQVGLVYVN